MTDPAIAQAIACLRHQRERHLRAAEEIMSREAALGHHRAAEQIAREIDALNRAPECEAALWALARVDWAP